MKHTLLFALLFLACFNAKAQTFIPAKDTVFVTLTSNDGEGSTDIIVSGGGSINIERKVIASDFPADWLKGGDFALCDNGICNVNAGDTFLWDRTTAKGRTIPFTYSGSGGKFALVLSNMHGKTAGCFYTSVRFTDLASGGTVDTITFVVCRSTVGIATPENTKQGISLYPNPAANELNVVSSPASGVKTIALYNMIGKMMNVYKVNDGSANLDISNVPAGIYFAKLYNSTGNTIATKKFIKQ
ncbi:MAG: hypothetical protein JWQ38_625 [Flavipsychrobacter sp.]|nr:hypothetical protein [Flavipsychrobacter sp.]